MEKKYTDFTEYRKVQTARILSNYKETDELIKAYDEQKIEKSEGSRGGKVIGHTKSGKPIYEHRPYEHHSKEELHKLADKKAGRDRMNAINELSLRYEQSSGKKASTLALDRKEPFITKEKGAQPSYKHISDMSKMSVEEHDKEIDRLQEIRNNRYIRNDKYNDEDKKANDEAFEQQKIHISHKNALLSKQEDSKRGEVGKVEKSESTDLSKAFETLGI